MCVFFACYLHIMIESITRIVLWIYFARILLLVYSLQRAIHNVCSENSIIIIITDRWLLAFIYFMQSNTYMIVMNLSTPLLAGVFVSSRLSLEHIHRFVFFQSSFPHLVLLNMAGWEHIWEHRRSVWVVSRTSPAWPWWDPCRIHSQVSQLLTARRTLHSSAGHPPTSIASSSILPPVSTPSSSPATLTSCVPSFSSRAWTRKPVQVTSFTSLANRVGGAMNRLPWLRMVGCWLPPMAYIIQWV